MFQAHSLQLAILLLAASACLTKHPPCMKDDDDDDVPGLADADDDASWNDHHNNGMNTMFMQFIVMKGCSYLSVYVMNHYMPHHPSDHHHATVTACDWKTWVTDRGTELHVPTYFTHALIDCGQHYSFQGLRVASYHPPHNCHTINASSLVGRSAVYNTLSGEINDLEHHHPDDHSEPHGESDSSSDKHPRPGPDRITDVRPIQDVYMYMPPGPIADKGAHAGPIVDGDINARPGPDKDIHAGRMPDHDTHVNPQPSTNISNEMSSQSEKSPHTQPLPIVNPHGGSSKINYCKLRKMCKTFTRYVNHRFHLKPIPSSWGARRWLMGVYEQADLQGVPLKLTHGIIGCGKQSALHTFTSVPDQPPSPSSYSRTLYE